MLCVSPHAPMAGRWELTEEQWEVVEPVLRPDRRADNRGRPWQDTRAGLNGGLWVLGTGAQWRELPEKYPPYQTCHRRFQQWVRSGKLEGALRLRARHLREQGKLNLEEAFVDATFASAKKGGLPSAPPGAARGRRSSLSPLITVFLSPYLSRALLPTNASLSKRSSPEVSSMNSPKSSSETKPTTRTDSINNSNKRTASSGSRPTGAGAERRRTDASCGATRDDGKWSGSSPGCTPSADSLPDGNITSRTSSASSTSPASTCSSDIYETGSRTSLINISSREKWHSMDALCVSACADGRTLGVDRRTVGSSRAGAASGPACGQPRSPVAGHASGIERGVVGAGRRRAVARVAGEVSAVPDLPPPVPAVGAVGEARRGS